MIFEFSKRSRARRIIVVDPQSGQPVIKGTRIPVYLIAELLKRDQASNGTLPGYPTLKRKDLDAVRVYAAANRKP